MPYIPHTDKDVAEMLGHGGQCDDFVRVNLHTESPPVESWTKPNNSKRPITDHANVAIGVRTPFGFFRHQIEVERSAPPRRRQPLDRLVPAPLPAVDQRYRAEHLRDIDLMNYTSHPFRFT